MLRLGLSGVAFAALAFSQPAASQVASSAQRAAYRYAIRCLVAGAMARKMPSENPGNSRTAALTAMDEKAYNAAFNMGGRLGYSDREINADMDRAQVVEARSLMQDHAYFAQTKSACVRLGLMLP